MGLPGGSASAQLTKGIAEDFFYAERTFTTEGHAAALRVVTDLLERLDDDALRAYAYQHGIRTEDEFPPA